MEPPGDGRTPPLAHWELELCASETHGRFVWTKITAALGGRRGISPRVCPSSSEFGDLDVWVSLSLFMIISSYYFEFTELDEGASLPHIHTLKYVWRATGHRACQLGECRSGSHSSLGSGGKGISSRRTWVSIIQFGNGDHGLSPVPLRLLSGPQTPGQC